MATAVAHLVKQVTADPMFEGSNQAPAGTEGKIVQ